MIAKRRPGDAPLDRVPAGPILVDLVVGSPAVGWLLVVVAVAALVVWRVSGAQDAAAAVLACLALWPAHVSSKREIRRLH